MNPIGTYGMHLGTLENAPCQSRVLDGDTVITECRHTLGNHPRGASRRYLHENAEQTARWYIDDHGDTHLYGRPGAACSIERGE